MVDMNYMRLKWELFKAKFFGEENGAVDLIVIVILIAIVIILAIIFRDEIGKLISKIFGQADEAAKNATSGADKLPSAYQSGISD